MRINEKSSPFFYIILNYTKNLFICVPDHLFALPDATYVTYKSSPVYIFEFITIQITLQEHLFVGLGYILNLGCHKQHWFPQWFQIEQLIK